MSLTLGLEWLLRRTTPRHGDDDGEADSAFRQLRNGRIWSTTFHITHTLLQLDIDIKMAALPSPPFVEIPGVANFRGIGGGHIGPGLIYRAADPTRATKSGLEKMSKDLGKVSGLARFSGIEWHTDGCEKV